MQCSHSRWASPGAGEHPTFSLCPFDSFKEDNGSQPDRPLSSPSIYVMGKCIIWICHIEARLSTLFWNFHRAFHQLSKITATRDSWSFLTLFAKLTTSVCIPVFKIIIKWFQMHGPSVDSIHDPTLNPVDPETQVYNSKFILPGVSLDSLP